jgi:MFS family permease
LSHDESAETSVGEPHGSQSDERAAAILAREPRNLISLAILNVIQRASWVFKTESVIIPRFLDVIAGSGAMRGWLPILNRAGQSLPPLFLADKLRQAPLKRKPLIFTATAMGVSMLSLAGLWLALGETTRPWLPYAFLGIYVSFFVANGFNQLIQGTLSGKLIRAHRRGRLLAIAGLVGAAVSSTLAWFLMQRWLQNGLTFPAGGYVMIFGFAGCGFIIAGLMSFALKEPPDDPSALPPRNPKRALKEAWQVFRTDRAFRRAATVAMLFISVQFLFPHFQAFSRHRWGSHDEGFHLMIWVIAQNLSVGGLSWMSGTIADRFGNRLAIRIQVFLCSLTPILTLALTHEDLIDDGRRWFWIAFVFLGLVPVTMKTFINYTLELTTPENHPRYVSTMSVCFAVPFVLSPGVGWLIDQIGFEPIFAFISGSIFIGFLLTFRMFEPRGPRVQDATPEEEI